MLMILLAVFDETVRGGEAAVRGFAGLCVFRGMDAAGAETRRCDHGNSEIPVRPQISMAPLYNYFSHLRVSFDGIQMDALVVRRRSLGHTLSSGKGGNAKHASPPLQSMEICGPWWLYNKQRLRTETYTTNVHTQPWHILILYSTSRRTTAVSKLLAHLDPAHQFAKGLKTTSSRQDTECMTQNSHSCNTLLSTTTPTTPRAAHCAASRMPGERGREKKTIMGR